MKKNKSSALIAFFFPPALIAFLTLVFSLTLTAAPDQSPKQEDALLTATRLRLSRRDDRKGPHLIGLPKESAVAEEFQLRADTLSFLPASFFELSVPAYRVPLRRARRVKLFSGDSKIGALFERNQGEIPESGPILLLKNRENCMDLVAIDESTTTQNFNLCASVKPERRFLKFLPGTSGAFYYRRPSGGWVEGAAGIFTQAINNPSARSSLLDSTKISAQLALGGWWKNWQLEASIRSPVIGLGASTVRPQWIRVAAGFGLEPYAGDIWTIHLTALAATDVYKNKIQSGQASSSGNYISSFTAPSVGLRSSFIYRTRAEVGGDLFYTILQNSQKFSVQGDLRYWLTPSVALGARYWLDLAQVSSTTHLSQTSLALESYLRYVF